MKVMSSAEETSADSCCECTECTRGRSTTQSYILIGATDQMRKHLCRGHLYSPEPDTEPSRRCCSICKNMCRQKCPTCRDVYFCGGCWAAWWRDHTTRCQQPEPKSVRRIVPDPLPEPVAIAIIQQVRFQVESMRHIPCRLLNSLTIPDRPALICTCRDVYEWFMSPMRARTGFRRLQ